MAAPRIDRRLTAVLAADVVGYSRLVQRDEQGPLGRLKAHRGELVEPLVAEHGGRVVKLMGDGILCEFPSASTRSPARSRSRRAWPSASGPSPRPSASASASASTSATSSTRAATSSATG